MNDPNGMVVIDGVYHLFFQYNPFGADWGYMSWGHAVSEDMVTWRELDVAIPWLETDEAFSGSAVDDVDNTSGLGIDGIAPVVAVYTSVLPDRIQAQSLAVSTDRGATWSRHGDGPVLGRGTRDFRDPKLFRHVGADGVARWIMVAVEAKDGEILVHSSPNLHDWTYESTIAPAGAEGLIWECPDLFPLPVDGDADRVAWVLVVSTITPGEGVEKDTAMNYVVGQFDGHTFTSDASARWRRLDYGRDAYAGVTFSGVPGERRIMIAWMSNWQYAREVPTAPFRGAMSLPRELSLHSRDGAVELRQRVPEEVEATWPAAELAVDEELAPGEERSHELGTHAVLDLVWTPGEADAFEVTLGSLADDRAALTYDVRRGNLAFRRAPHRAMPEGFAGETSMDVPAADGRLRLRIVVDAHLVEIFADDGAAVMSHQLFGVDDGWVARLRGHGGVSSVTVTARRG